MHSHETHLLQHLRKRRWVDVPTDPGVYWWYFPSECIESLGIARYCNMSTLRLLSDASGNLCLYHGIANSLSQRIQWHAEQRLDASAMRSGFLSTFRFTLLALNDFDYMLGDAEINAFYDRLNVRWQITSTREEALAIESANLSSGVSFPLNISGNQSPGVRDFTKFLKAQRKSYKQLVLSKLS